MAHRSAKKTRKKPRMTKTRSRGSFAAESPMPAPDDSAQSRTPSGAVRAAALLDALGPEIAAAVRGHLVAAAADQVRAGAAQLPIARDTLKEVAGTFVTAFAGPTPEL